MISRREFVLLSLGVALMPETVLAAQRESGVIGWNAFLAAMTKLADDLAAGALEQSAVTKNGVEFLQQLDTDSAAFKAAVDEAFETGNRYWLWQRMVKQKKLNGGILNIDNQQLVQLHDHPGATGMMRIISGEAEVWQFDKTLSRIGPEGIMTTELRRVSHRVLKPGDTAVLTPTAGNIHALRSVTDQCSMLDFFIPPYQTSNRSWYLPLDDDWFNSETITCRSIPQHEFAKA